MMLKNGLKMLAVSAAALIGAFSLVSPASAYHVTYEKVCYSSWYGYRCFYVPTTTARTTTTTTQSTAPRATAPTTTSTSTATTAGLTAQEQQMLNLVNGERAKYGLAPLKADLELTKLARLKSQDMISKNYFSHNSPTYGSPFQMMQRYGISYRTAGENIAGNGSVSGAHTSLMNSSGHRANILSTQFTHVGIGIVSGGNYGMMFTQMFVGR